MKTILTFLFGSAILLLWVAPCLAGWIGTPQVIDTFSDGDDSNNPTWVHGEDPNVASPVWEVVDDGTGNLVYHMCCEKEGIFGKIWSWVSGKKDCNRSGTDCNKKNNPFTPGTVHYKAWNRNHLCFHDNYTGYALQVEIDGGDPNNPLFAISLLRLDPENVEVVLASTTMAYTGEWMREYAQRIDDSGRIVCKVWPSSDPEPDTYLFDVTDNTYTSGYSAISIGYSGGNTEGSSWYFDDVVVLPEPMSICLLTVGGLAIIRRPRR